MQISNIDLSMEIGAFHDLVAMRVAPGAISLYTNRGEELVLQFYASFANPPVSGEFGEVPEIQGFEVLRGIELARVNSIKTSMGFEYGDYHVRTLDVAIGDDLTATWKLFCEGKPNG